MKYKTLFRLGLKMLGLFLIVEGAASIITSVSYALWEFYNFTYPPPQMLPYSSPRNIVLRPIAGLTGVFFKIMIGYYFFRRGQWTVDRAIPSNRPYCPDCGYELTGMTNVRYPECGTPIPGSLER